MPDATPTTLRTRKYTVCTTVPVQVARALDRCSVQYSAATRALLDGGAEREVACRQLALIAERERRWLGVLHRWVYSSHGTVPLVFGRVVSRAEAGAATDAQFWAAQALDHSTRSARHDQEDQR